MARRATSPTTTPVDVDHVAAIDACPPVPVPLKADGEPDLRAFIDACKAVPAVVAADAWAVGSRARLRAVSAATASLNWRSYCQ